MSSLQKQIADILTTELADEDGEFVVRGYPWQPDGAERDATYVSVYRTLTERAPNQGNWRNELSIVVMTGHQDPAVSDEALSDGLDAVLYVLDKSAALTFLKWDQATRTVINDTFPAVTVSVECMTRPGDQEE